MARITNVRVRKSGGIDRRTKSSRYMVGRSRI
jgi:hypothetical protein